MSEKRDGVKSSKPTFWHPAPIPFEESMWRRAGFRERLRLWGDVLDRGNPFPVYFALIYAVKLPMWFAVFNYMFRNRRLPFSAEINVKRWIVYNVLHDVLGLGATSGPLGFKFNPKVPCEAWWYFLTPGTLTVPLLPQLGGIRRKSTVALFVGYILALLRALLAPKIGLREVGPPLGFLASLAPFDLMPFFASRGEHYVYQMICLAFKGPQWRFGCQMVQVALWTFAGLSKMGPWFKYVVGFMTPNCVFFANHVPQVRRMLLCNPPRDIRPNMLCTAFAHAGTATEALMALLLLSPRTAPLGLLTLTGFHCYIISQTPFASVFEWNIYSILMGWYLFREGVQVPKLSPALVGFLCSFLVALPVYGQLYPDKVPFLMAYRPYAGNWRFMWCVLAKSAVSRFKRLKTIDSPLASDRIMALAGDEHGYKEHIEYMMNNAMLIFPNYRALPGIVDELNTRNGRTIDDVHVTPHVPFENYVLGWSLGIGWSVYRDSFRAAVQQVCGFQAGDCYFVQFEPMGLMDRTMHWRAIDVSSGEIVLKGHNHYSELEALEDPMSLKIECKDYADTT